MTNQLCLPNYYLQGHQADSAIQFNILKQFDFKNAVQGTPVFFRNTKTLVQYGIAKVQKIFHEKFYNVTHLGIVSESTNQKVCLIEAVAEGVTEKCYTLDDLVKEEVCFPVTKHDSFFSQIVKFARDKLKKPRNYNLKGAIQQPLVPRVFTEAQKNRMIEVAIDHFIGGDLIKSKEDYFCSEFASEILQTAYLLRECPEIKERMNPLIVSTNPNERDTSIRKIMNKLDVKSIWEKISSNPLFMTPTAATSPSDLFAVYANSEPLICVSSDYQPSPCRTMSDDWECLEFLVIQQLDRLSKGQQISLDNIERQRLIFEMSKKTGYSTKTLSCIFSKLDHVQELRSEIEKCLKSTLSYAEQIKIYFLSRALLEGLDRLQENPLLLEQLQSPDDAVVEAAAKAVFPINPLYSRHFISNICILVSLKNKTPEFFSKYLPLASLYDTTILQKITVLGPEIVYAIFERFTTLDKQIFRCLHKCEAKNILPCAAQCLHPEAQAIQQIEKNIENDIDRLVQKPEVWLKDLLLRGIPPFFESSLAAGPYLNPNSEMHRTLNPIDKSVYRDILLRFGLLRHLIKHPQTVPDKLRQLFSYENFLRIIENRTVEDLAKTSILSKAGCSSFDDYEKCLYSMQGQVDKMFEHLESKEASLLSSENIGLFRKRMKSREFILKELLAAARNPDLIVKLLRLSKSEWDAKSFEEKLSFLTHLAFPKFFRVL